MEKKEPKTMKRITKKSKEQKKKITDLEGNEIPGKSTSKPKRKSIKEHFRKYKKLYLLICLAIAILFIAFGMYMAFLLCMIIKQQNLVKR